VKRRRKNGRLFVASFGLTVAVLVVLLVALLVVPPTFVVPSRSIPTTLPSYPVSWTRYVPSNVLTVSVVNYTMIRHLNSSAVPADDLLDLTNPRENLTSAMVNALVVASFSTPNGTASVIYLTAQGFSQFAGPLEKAYSQVLGSKPEFYYTSAQEGNASQAGWLALVPSGNIVAFAFGASPAREAIDLCLEAANGTATSILQRSDIRQVLYILNGTQNHLSFSVQDFPGLVSTGNLTALSVDDAGTTIHVSYVVEFKDSATAKSQEGYMRDNYLTAVSFTQYDRFLEALESQPFAQLQYAVRLVG